MSSRHSSCRPGDPSAPREGSPCSDEKTPSPSPVVGASPSPPTQINTTNNHLAAALTTVPTNPTMLAKPVDHNQPEEDMSAVLVGTN